MATATATSSKAKSAAKATKTQTKSPKKEKETKATTKKSDKPASTDSVIQSSIKASKDKIDAGQLKRALEALLQHETKKRDESKELFETDIPIQIQVGLLKAPGYAGPKPHRILLPHSIRTANDEAPEVCLIVKDSSKEWLQELLPHFPDHLGCIKKILTLTSLRTKHHTFAQRRALGAKYSHFLADDRILPMLPASLGKDFYRHNRVVPVSLTRKEALPFTIQRAMQSTHLKMSKGTCWTVAIGTIKHTSEELVDNSLAAVTQCVGHVPQQWNNVLSLCLKTPQSMALPFYNVLPEQLIDKSTLRSEEEIEAELKLARAEQAKERKETAVAKKEKRSLSDEKSPLLRALKKQKAAEETKAAAAAADASSDKAEVKASKVKAPKSKESIKAKAVEDAPASISKTRKEPTKPTTAAETLTPDTKKSKKRDENDDTPSSSSKKVKKTPDKEPETAAASPNANYLASKKFTGSKNGYVFKKGPQGLGYYKDTPPVVDAMAMEAIKRMAKEGQRKSGGGKGGKKHSGGGGFKGKKQQSRGRR